MKHPQLPQSLLQRSQLRPSTMRAAAQHKRAAGSSSGSRRGTCICSSTNTRQASNSSRAAVPPPQQQLQQLQQQQLYAALPPLLPPPQPAAQPARRPASSSSRSGRRRALATGLAAACLAPLANPWRAAASLIDETVAQSVFALAGRSVVSINDYSSQGGAQRLEGVGTGVIWDRYGHVVTNYHVVSKYVLDKSGQQVVKVVLGDGSGSASYQAAVVGTDAMHDLAVLKIDVPSGQQLAPIRMGTSADLKVGQSVYAVGNPSGLTKTLTAGLVSGLNRTIPAPTGTRIYGCIQTDASVNAGNSGGPLLDSFGRLVGLCTASFTRSGSGRGSGVNFALPADLLRTTVPNLIVTGNAAGRGVRSGGVA